MAARRVDPTKAPAKVDSSLDVKDIVKRFVAFRDSVVHLFNECESAIVTLPFDFSNGDGKLFTFAENENINLTGIGIDTKSKRLTYHTASGSINKVFGNEEAELIEVTYDKDGSSVIEDLDLILKEEFRGAFASCETRMASITAFQALIRNNPGLEPIINDCDRYLDNLNAEVKAAQAYGSLLGFGKY